MTHLPTASEPPARIPRLVAWLAARRGDAKTEARALERLVAIDPEDFAAVDRLIQLEARPRRRIPAAEAARPRTSRPATTPSAAATSRDATPTR